MKKTLLLLFLLFIFFTAQSQVAFSPGVRAGVNLANFTNLDLNAKTDFYIGVFAAIKFARFYTLQPEINYTRQGADSRLIGSIEVQYLSIDLANKFTLITDLGLHAIIGPAINFKLNDNFDNFNDEIEDFDIVFFDGLGYEFDFGLAIEARYNIGLVDIFGSNINNNVSIYK